MEANLIDLTMSISQMPAVLWASGPGVKVVDFERREMQITSGDSFELRPYLVYLIEVETSTEEPLKLYKRFSDIEKLHSRLGLEPPTEFASPSDEGPAAGPGVLPSDLPSLPEKTWNSMILPFLGADDKIGEERVSNFHRYFRQIGQLVCDPTGKVDLAWRQSARALLEEFFVPEQAAKKRKALELAEAQLQGATRVQAWQRGRVSRASTALQRAAALEAAKVVEDAEAEERSRLRHFDDPDEGTRLQSVMSLVADMTEKPASHSSWVAGTSPPMAAVAVPAAETVEPMGEQELARRARVKAAHMLKLAEASER